MSTRTELQTQANNWKRKGLNYRQHAIDARSDAIHWDGCAEVALDRAAELERQIDDMARLTP